MFDVALEDAAKSDKRDRDHGGRGGPNSKRQKRDQKFGFGGKKRHSKSNDKESSMDMGGFSNKANKARFGNKKRPGKSARASRR